eukprot:TRINITY_DN21488_c0_g1_i1.p2 TRINITY_DN21488_c0_g1~~TRINITY_DN21488_c0_g1_i1.p2  ORF type:complete len:108 (+),score=23.20 TRINITY_DN21488_c0_g1_i1:46-369(+)
MYTRSIVGSVRCVQETGYQRRVHGNEIKDIENQIWKLNELSVQVHEEMSALRLSGSDQQVISTATMTKVIGFGIVSLAIIIGSAIIQILYLRRFFRQKKINQQVTLI